MQNQPLTADDFDFIDELFLSHGDDHSVLNASELDGFLSALVSGPTPVDIAVWFPAIWGGDVPQQVPAAKLQRLIELSVRHLNTRAGQLSMDVSAFEPRFEETEHQGQPLTVAEEWCFGYLRGVEVAGWAALPAALAPITLLAEQDEFELPLGLDVRLHRQRVAAVRPAALALHDYWLSRR